MPLQSSLGDRARLHLKKRKIEREKEKKERRKGGREGKKEERNKQT